LKSRRIDAFSNRDGFERIEILDREVELLLEEFERVWEIRTATRKQHAAGSAATVLAAIIIRGAGNFRRQTGQRIADALVALAPRAGAGAEAVEEETSNNGASSPNNRSE
jgi:hypothetical protein